MDAWGQRELPRRAAHTVSRELDGEFIVLNTETDEAHHLNGEAAQVWAALDGRVPIDVPQDLLTRVVPILKERGLLADEGGSRRRFLRAGTVGGAAVAVAGLQTILLPEAAWAGSNDLTFTKDTAGSFSFNIGHYVTSVTITLRGGGGGGGVTRTPNAGGQGGNGGAVLIRMTLPSGRTTPTTFTGFIGAGGAAGISNTTPPAATGYRSGGTSTGGGGGGGSSVLYLPGTTTPLVVAGGGGGGGGANTGQNEIGSVGGAGGLILNALGPANGAAGAGGQQLSGSAGSDSSLAGVSSTGLGGGGGAGGGGAGSAQQKGGGGGGGGLTAATSQAGYTFAAVQSSTFAASGGGSAATAGSAGFISVVFAS